MNGWTGGQYSLYWAVVGGFLLVRFVALVAAFVTAFSERVTSLAP